MRDKTKTTESGVPAPTESSGSVRPSYLAGIVTGVIFTLLWAATAVVVWTIPEKAPAVAAITSMVMITLTVLIIIITTTYNRDK